MWFSIAQLSSMISEARIGISSTFFCVFFLLINYDMKEAFKRAFICQFLQLSSVDSIVVLLPYNIIIAGWASLSPSKFCRTRKTRSRCSSVSSNHSRRKYSFASSSARKRQSKSHNRRKDMISTGSLWNIGKMMRRRSWNSSCKSMSNCSGRNPRCSKTRNAT